MGLDVMKCKCQGVCSGTFLSFLQQSLLTSEKLCMGAAIKMAHGQEAMAYGSLQRRGEIERKLPPVLYWHPTPNSSFFGIIGEGRKDVTMWFHRVTTIIFSYDDNSWISLVCFYLSLAPRNLKQRIWFYPLLLFLSW